MEKKVIGICNGSTCCQYNSTLREYAASNQKKTVLFEEAMCLGLCESAPNIRVDESGERSKYGKVDTSLLDTL